MDKNLPAEPAPAGKSGAWPTGVMNAIRDVAGLIVCIFLSFVALLPVSGFVLFKKPWAAVVLAACGAALYWFHRRPSRFAPAIQAAFYGLVGVNLALAAALLFVASPLIFPIAAAAGVLHHFLAKRWGPHRALMLFAFAIVIFLLVALPFNLKMLVGLIFIAILIPLLLRGAERAPSLLASSAIVTAICVGAFAVSFYYGFFPKETAKVARQPGMRLLVDPRLIEKSQHSDRQMFAAKSCDRTQVLIGSESGAWVKHPTGPRLMEQVLDYRVGDQLVYDCANNAAWLGMYAPGGIVKLGPDFRVAQIFPAPGRAVTNLRQAGRLLLGGDDMSTDGVVFDLASQSFRPALRGVGSRDLLWDPRSNQTIGATAFFVRWSDLPTGRVTRSLFVPSIQIRLDLDETRGDLYVSSFMNGVLYRVDAATGAIRGRLRLGAGLRYLLVLADESLLAAGNYATGELYLVRLPDLRLVATVFAGRRIRALSRSPGDHEITFVSAAGVFAWDWRQAIKPTP